MTTPINNLNQVIYQTPTVGQINSSLSQAPVVAQEQAQKQKAAEFQQALATVAQAKKTEASGRIQDQPRKSRRRKARKKNAYANKPEEQASGLIDRIV